MSNILQEKSPTPSLPDFIRSLVLVLDAMHREGKAHGAIKVEVNTWLNPTNDAFAPPRFRSAAIPATSDKPDITEDVVAFMDCARFWISRSLDHQAFRATNYRYEGLPMPFLELLEMTGEGDFQPPAMSDFLKALDGEPKGLPEEPVAQPASELASPPAEATQPAPEPAPSPAEIPQLVHASAGIPISIALPNGTVGKPYEIAPEKIARTIAAQLKDDPDRARIGHLQIPDDCGLCFDQTTGAVSGVPTRNLEQQLDLTYIPYPSAPGTSCKASLFINPDPASLWQDLPTNNNAPYQKESLDHEEYSFGHFRVVAASRRGRSHANRGDFRDDDFAIGHADSTGWLVVAVADGAGSAKYSRQGSLIATQVARDWLVSTLNSPEYADTGIAEPADTATQPVKPRRALRDLLYDAARLAHFKIKEEAEDPRQILPEPAVIRNYDTTLILLLIKKLDTGYLAATFSVGDGGAGLLLEPETAIPLTRADGGEHAGQTTFVTIASSLADKEENLVNRYSQTIEPEFTAVLAMTDGITDPKFPSDAAFSDPKCWHALWDELKPAVENSSALLEWMNFFSPGNHDDRTLVAVMPAKAPFSE
ncbi:MAG: protein phosphatase 2C domain-containing protein [Verrucomicrobia bacterium]|nr:MAG: protein phosphatase 2C domain-containing protein [Verrucomicrobiota bacterium]